MFGMKMWIQWGDSWLMLAPFRKEDMKVVTEGWQRLDILEHNFNVGASTLEDEEEWYEKVRNEKDSCVWGIFLWNNPKPIGVTGIHGIDRTGGCRTGIVIWDKEQWGKGIASAAHLARTMFAADFLGRMTISSGVVESNIASKKALGRVGYVVTGRELRANYRKGKYTDALIFSWIHPERVDILYPEGLPDPDSDNIQSGLNNAKLALEKAREVVRFDPPELEPTN